MTVSDRTDSCRRLDPTTARLPDKYSSAHSDKVVHPGQYARPNVEDNTVQAELTRSADSNAHVGHAGSTALSSGLVAEHGSDVLHKQHPIPLDTRRAAHAAMQDTSTHRQTAQPAVDVEAEEDVLEQRIAELRKQGRIGHGTRTPAHAQHSVAELPPLRLSATLAHAAAVAEREHSNGYQLLGGKRPRHRMKDSDAASLKSLAAGRSQSMDAALGVRGAKQRHRQQ